MRFAAIDIGSNAVKCLVASVADHSGSYKVIREMYARVPLRLGTDVFDHGSILNQTRLDLIEAVKAFSMQIKLWKVGDALIGATSAMRDAKNGKEILEELHRATGLPARIIPGREEAMLVADMYRYIEAGDAGRLVVDAGGGSTDITFISGQLAPVSESFRIGAVRMLMHGFPEQEFRRMYRFIDKHRKPDHLLLIGSGGNIHALCSHFSRAARNELSLNELDHAWKELRGLRPEERVNRHQISSDRADVIVPAAEIFLNIMKHLGVNRLRVPGAGLADALVLRQFLRLRS